MGFLIHGNKPRQGRRSDANTQRRDDKSAYGPRGARSYLVIRPGFRPMGSTPGYSPTPPAGAEKRGLRFRLFPPWYDRRVHSRAGYILVGGRSSRFGRDKALLEIQGRPLALHLADIVGAAVDRGSRQSSDRPERGYVTLVTLVGPPAKYGSLGLRVIPDSVEGAGPLAGLVAALEDSSSAWNLVTACDMPYLHLEFLEFLFEQAEAGESDILLAISPLGVPEPLCAVYSLRAREALRGALERGTRKITDAFGALEVRWMLRAEYAHLDPHGRVFTNVNTLADWKTVNVR